MTWKLGEDVEAARKAMWAAWSSYCEAKAKYELAVRKRDDEVDAMMQRNEQPCA